MQDQKLRVDIIGDASKLNRALNTASGKLQSFGSKISGIGKRLSVGLTLPLGIAGGAAIKMAADFEESMNKVNVAFKDASGEVKEFSKTTLSEFGIAQGTALDMAALFGDMSTSMGLTTNEAAKMSTALVGLAGDLASFKNMNIEEVTTALNGVFTGETESLKRLGIVMTQVNLQQFAMEQGIKKTIKQMTQAEKVQLRYNFVMAKTSNAQGDFARTSDGAANQMRIFQESMKELGATFGAVILPAFTKLVSFGNDVLKTLKNLDPVTKNVVVVFAALAASAGPLLYLAGTVIPALAAAFAALTLSSGLIVVAIAAVVAALGATVKYQSLKSSIESLNKDIPELRKNYEKLRKEHDLTAESSLGIYNAQRKLLKSELALLKLQQDKEQGAIATMLGIESDEYVRLSQEISNTEQSIKNFDLSISGLEKQVKSTSDETKDLGTSLKDLKAIELTNLQLKWDLEDEAKQFAQEFDEAIGKEFAAMDSMSFTDVFNEKVAEAFDPDSVPVMDEFDTAEMDLDEILNSDQHQAFLDKMQKMSEISQAVGGEVANAFNQMGMSLVNSLGLADDGFQGFVKGLIGTITQLIAMMLSSAIAQSIAGATASGTATGPAAVVTTPAFIATAVGGILGAFAAIPKFANGGIVSGPTLGLMGEYPGSKSNPEVIAPLDKLQGMMGGGASQNVNVGGEFKINGQDLVVALQRADRNRSRIK
tara:strand:+ start:207 stop:2333 length:2127 start_codon:yes stop_codon:yes gene_type:complete